MKIDTITYTDDDLFEQVAEYIKSRAKDPSASLQELLRAGLCMFSQGKVASSIPKIYDSLPESIKPSVAAGMFDELYRQIFGLRKENEKLNRRLNSFLEIFGDRAKALLKTWDILEAKQEEHLRQVKEGKVKVWEDGDPEDRVTLTMPESPLKETEEEYEKRKADNKKWGIETE
jgi:hypothetical protein